LCLTACVALAIIGFIAKRQGDTVTGRQGDSMQR
jgi:hypothetical protein